MPSAVVAMPWRPHCRTKMLQWLHAERANSNNKKLSLAQGRPNYGSGGSSSFKPRQTHLLAICMVTFTASMPWPGPRALLTASTAASIGGSTRPYTNTASQSIRCSKQQHKAADDNRMHAASPGEIYVVVTLTRPHFPTNPCMCVLQAARVCTSGISRCPSEARVSC